LQVRRSIAQNGRIDGITGTPIGETTALVGVKGEQKDGKAVQKAGETQLVKLADPKGSARPKNVKGYWAIFCVHLDKTP
jgi:hypothetical protein